MERTILHCDMNNFYTSVECLLNPKLKPYPVAVCGNVEERHGIVLAKNYKAKALSVSTGEAIWQAKQKCKDLVVVPPHYEEYMKFSKAAREIYEDYTDQVEAFGMDECWLDVTGSTMVMGSGEKIANEIREHIKFELGLTISAGVYGSIAQSESENISANVKWGKAQSAKDGNVAFHYKGFLGYRKGEDDKTIDIFIKLINDDGRNEQAISHKRSACY